ncbi:competence protein CoiA family protein [Actinomadura sediminis]|uniref:Competence protein CoiA family protein n=1 Tax=Actinomadura sediminis TaxID=1038904 RepID=A0ABW3ET67_9ACTN
MLDPRKVQTAVLDGPMSLHPIAMPFDRPSAKLMRGRYEHRGFYCGKWLGGCGKKLQTKIGEIRIPHFSHIAEGRTVISCRRPSNDEKSADHLYIRRDLAAWARDQGRQVGDMRLNGEVPGEGGLCSGVTVPLQDGGVLEVSIRDGFGKHAKRLWDRRNRELAGGRRQQIDWLFAEGLDLEHVYAEQGYAFMIKCDYVGMERSVKIGTKTRGRVTEWADLSECRLTDEGLWTPFLADAKARHPRRRKTPSQPPAPPKAKKAKAAKPRPSAASRSTDLPGFPVIPDQLRVVPRAQMSTPVHDAAWGRNAHVLPVRIGDGARNLAGTGAKLLLPNPATDLQPEELHRLEPPCTVMTSAEDWVIYAAGIEPLNLAPSTSEPPKKSPETEAGQDEAPIESEKQRETRKVVESLLWRMRNVGVAETAKISEMIEAAMPLLSEADRRWAENQIRRLREQNKRMRNFREKRQRPAVDQGQAEMEMSHWLDMALAELELGNRHEARRCHAIACEMFGRLPPKQVTSARRRLDGVRQLIEKPDPIRAGRGAPGQRPARGTARRPADDGIEKVVPGIRQLLETAARNQAFITWHQLQNALTRKLPTDPISRRLILIKVDSETDRSEPLLSALVVTGDSEMDPLYPEVARALGRGFDSNEDAEYLEWSMHVLRVHRTWRYR